MEERKFAHEPIFCQQNGRVKVYCRCGAQSRKLDSYADAVASYKDHVGLKELERKQRLH